MEGVRLILPVVMWLQIFFLPVLLFIGCILLFFLLNRFIAVGILTIRHVWIICLFGMRTTGSLFSVWMKNRRMVDC